MFTLAVTVALTIGCSSGGQATFQFDGDVALSYVEAQMNFGDRIPNTEGHRLTGDAGNGPSGQRSLVRQLLPEVSVPRPSSNRFSRPTSSAVHS